MWRSIRKHSKREEATKPKGLPQKRFRVLTLGPANAGKTTLLERLSNGPAGAARVVRNGRHIKEVLKGYDHRGIHNINDEITYTSNPGFVFHDSSGFEAGGGRGGRERVEFYPKAFVSSAVRATARDLALSSNRQRSALWIPEFRLFLQIHSRLLRTSPCIPLAPIIGIFAKSDGREMEVMTAVLDPTPSLSDFLNPSPGGETESR